MNIELQVKMLYKNASQLDEAGFVADFYYIAKEYARQQNGTKPLVKCWCFLCHVELIEEKDKLEMHGETVCSQCWDENMYIALQDGGGV